MVWFLPMVLLGDGNFKRWSLAARSSVTGSIPLKRTVGPKCHPLSFQTLAIK
jgi:hypothetical protein